MNENLGAPDSHFVRAAQGWMELGCRIEAEMELAHVSAANRHHPEVLETEWSLTAARLDWLRGVVIGELLVTLYPERADGWLHRAYAIRRVENGGLSKARESLLPAAEQFPSEPVIPYNLACYAAQMGELDEARKWLKRSFNVGRFETIQTMSLSDSDLKPLWEEIRRWKKSQLV